MLAICLLAAGAVIGVTLAVIGAGVVEERRPLGRWRKCVVVG